MAETTSRITRLLSGAGGLRRRVTGIVRARVDSLADRFGLPGLETFVAPRPTEPAQRAHVEDRPSPRGVIREEFVRRTIFPEPDARPARAPTASNAPRPGPPPGVRHLTETVERRLRQLRDAEAFESKKDPVEAVHDLRVASRRLRAFLDLFEPFLDRKLTRRAKRPLRRVTRAVGALREWDVHAEELTERLESSLSDAERASLEHLLDRIERRRAKERRRARRALDAIELDDIAPALREALDAIATRALSPSTTFDIIAWLALEPAIDVARRARPTADGAEHTGQMHDFRIAIKKLRYAVELLKPALGDRYDGMHSEVTRLQTLLGDHHDRVVLQELFEKERDKLVAHGRTVLVRGCDAAIGRIDAERRELFKTFDDTRGVFDSDTIKKDARAALGPARGS